MRAAAVRSPIHRTRNHIVLFESPFAWDEEWSLVEAEVAIEDEGEWKRALGIRWDGDRRDPDSKGFPSSSGKAVWFWIPSALHPFFYGIIIPQLLDRRQREENEKVLRNQLSDVVEKLKALTA